MLLNHSSTPPIDGQVVLCQFVPIAKQWPSLLEQSQQPCSLPGQLIPLAL